MKNDLTLFPERTVKVTTDIKCDVCKKKLANYYITIWYIHVCSLECFNSFIDRYNREINEIALEIKEAKNLGDTDEV